MSVACQLEVDIPAQWFCQNFQLNYVFRSNTNFIASRHIKRDKFSLLFDVRLSKINVFA